MIGQLFRNNRRPSQAETLYQAIAELALRPAFFDGGAAPDTVEGRFDVLALHLALVLSRLKQEGSSTRELVEPLQREFFASLDDAMRRLGVGDMSVARKVRRMAEAFYGRFLAYDKALLAEDATALEEAVSRNLFGVERAATADRFAAYMLEARSALAAARDDEILQTLATLKAAADRIFATQGAVK